MPTDPSADRFQPHAARAMASMFDDVSGRYDLLNKVMSLGQDGAWREAMWRAVPPDARVVLDLATGSGVSLPGLRRAGRTLLGIDVSFAMLAVARDALESHGWAPRLVCADGFRLPLRAGALDAVTIAFGIRNFRPRALALAEIARVLRPGGTLVVLEATAPAAGPLQPLLAAYVRHAIPALGRLSSDPSAYQYLSRSIFEFGAGPEFEQDLAGAGLQIRARRSFLLGATRLWVARRGLGLGQNPTGGPALVQAARSESGEIPQPGRPAVAPADQAATWLGAQAGVSAVLTAALAYALYAWAKFHADLPLSPLQRLAGWWLLGGGLVVFGTRSLWMWLRWRAAAGRE